MRHRILRAFALVFLLATAGCFPKEEGEPRPVAETTVVVQNQSWLDVTLYAVHSGNRTRLGTVTGNSTARLRIPARLVGIGRDLTFLADPVGSNATASSFEEHVTPGDEITLTIPARIGR